MHIQDDQGQQFISENDVDRMERELFPELTKEEMDHQKEVERYRIEQMRNLKHPLELIEELSPNVKFLKETFEGFSTGVLKLKDQTVSAEKLSQIAAQMSRSSSNKNYEPFIDENGTRFLVENTLGLKVKFGGIDDFFQNIVKPKLISVDSSETRG